MCIARTARSAQDSRPGRVPGALQHRPAPSGHRPACPEPWPRSPRHRSRPRHVSDPPKTGPQRPDQRVRASRLKTEKAQVKAGIPFFERHRFQDPAGGARPDSAAAGGRSTIRIRRTARRQEQGLSPGNGPLPAPTGGASERNRRPPQAGSVTTDSQGCRIPRACRPLALTAICHSRSGPADDLPAGHGLAESCAAGQFPVNPQTSYTEATP